MADRESYGDDFVNPYEHADIPEYGFVHYEAGGTIRRVIRGAIARKRVQKRRHLDRLALQGNEVDPCISRVLCSHAADLSRLRKP